MKIKVGILGATGSVGQKFVQLLENHPWFEISALGASQRSAGKSYKEAVNWFMSTPIPEQIAEMKVSSCSPDWDCRIVFSGLDAEVAGEIESAFAKKGYIVVSNSKNHRFSENVPLLIPEVNADHLDLLPKQNFGSGAIITNPNCSTVGLVMALKPLYDQFGIEAVNVVTLQALSGAGYPGVSSIDIIDNVIPFIGGEEEKIAKEPMKILAKLQNGGELEFANFKVAATCNRVAVLDGHLECVSVKFKNKPSKEDLIAAWQNFSGEPQKLALPMAPKQPLQYFSEDKFPQPKLHRNLDKGMVVSLGRLRDCEIFDYKFVLLSHNTVRGAAGGAILNAELCVKKNLIKV